MRAAFDPFVQRHLAGKDLAPKARDPGCDGIGRSPCQGSFGWFNGARGFALQSKTVWNSLKVHGVGMAKQLAMYRRTGPDEDAQCLGGKPDAGSRGLHCRECRHPEFRTRSWSAPGQARLLSELPRRWVELAAFGEAVACVMVEKPALYN